MIVVGLEAAYVRGLVLGSTGLEHLLGVWNHSSCNIGYACPKCFLMLTHTRYFFLNLYALPKLKSTRLAVFEALSPGFGRFESSFRRVLFFS